MISINNLDMLKTHYTAVQCACIGISFIIIAL